jgi:hypothetical protein
MMLRGLLKAAFCGVLLLPSVGSAGDAVPGPSIDLVGREGAGELGPLRIEWKLNALGPCAPEATVLVRNSSREKVWLLVEILQRVCDGKTILPVIGTRCQPQIDRRTSLLVPGEGWNAFAQSLRGPFREEGGGPACEAVIHLRASEQNPQLGEATISIPVPTNGWGVDRH